MEAFRTVHTSVVADDGTVVTNIETASVDAMSLSDAVASTGDALDVFSDESAVVSGTCIGTGEESVSVSCRSSVMEEAI